MPFDWKQNLNKEVKSKRTHDTKHFPHPTEKGKMICIQSSGLMHAKTPNGFEDISTELPDYNFPEGKQILKEEARHHMLDLPEWGDAHVEENGKVVRVYDLDGVSIYKYHSPLVTVNGELPYEIKDKDGKKIKDGLQKDAGIDEIAVRKDTAYDADFEVVDKKLYFKLPQEVKDKVKDKYTLQAWDDTDTSSVNNKDTSFTPSTPTNNYGSSTTLFVESTSGNTWRHIIQFTLPSGSGTISDVTLNEYQKATNGAGDTLEVHELTRSNWVESQANWNVYSTGNNWTTSGGDYDATVIDSVASVSAGNWETWTIMGSGATNPLTLTWSDTVDLIVLAPNINNHYYQYWSSEYTTDTAKRPYLEITYSTGGSTFTPKVTIF